MHKRVIAALRNVWETVRPILCNDAPEGHVPEEVEEDVNLTTKDILSYSWRALKEARLVFHQTVRYYFADKLSSLLRVIVTKAPISDDTKVSLFRKDNLEALGTLCFTELAELRHRGAFSAVAQAFSACCSRAHTLRDPGLLKRLYGVSQSLTIF